MFEVGSVRRKNTKNILLKNTLDASIGQADTGSLAVLRPPLSPSAN